ncbi:MAG: ubiquinone/menaquinone biosynthesis methyltransferase [Thermoplasmata archaeon]
MPEDAGERSRVASDGSPYPDRTRPTFEHDVQAMFGYIAERYDWFDHVASLGNDFLWRPRALGQLDRFRSPGPIQRALDLGCGTGDLVRQVARRYPRAHVVGADFTGPMLANAQRRNRRASEGSRVALARATALHLPFADGAFDLVTNAFVARNLSDLGQAFREMRRVLRPGGTLLTLEITEPTSPTFGALFHAYFDRVVPWMGAAVASAGPYRYLPESLRTLPGRDALLGLMHVAGFPRAVPRPQSFGIVTTFLAEAGSSPHPSA